MIRHSRTLGGTVALGAAALLILTGCSTTPQADPEETVLTLGTDEPERLELLVPAFEKANPGVTVEVVSSGGQGYEEFMRTRIAAGTAPDVIRVFPGSGGNTMTVGQLAKIGVLADLSGAEWTDQLNDAQRTLFAGTDGKIVAVPLGATGLGPVYNDRALKDVGAEIPTTWDDVLALCATAKDAGRVAYSLGQGDLFVTQLTPYVMVASSLYGPDPEFTARQMAGEETFAESPWVDAFEQLLEMNSAGCFQEGVNGTSYDEANKLMGSGEALGEVTFADISSQLAAAQEGDTFTMTAFPTSDDEPYLAVADSYGFAVNKDAKELELAEKFIAFTASAEGQNAFADQTGGVPSLPNDQFEASSPQQQQVADYIAAGRTAIWPDQLWPSPEIQQTLFVVVQNLFNDLDTPESAAKKMDDAFAAALAG
jgi:raffinose/stachyose/melibiose transport system substrate-binding protein